MLKIFPDGVGRAITERDNWRGGGISTSTRSESSPRSISVAELEMYFSGSASRAGLVSSHEAYRESPWIQPSIHASASALAAREFRMFRRVGKTKEQLASHWLLDLMAQPNLYAKTPEYLLKYQTFALYFLDGEVLWHLGRDGKSKSGSKRVPIQFITVFRKHDAQPAFDRATREFLGWQLSVDGQQHFADRNDVIHFPYYDPLSHRPGFNPFTRQILEPARGRSPLDSKRLAITTDLAMARFNADFFGRGVAPNYAFLSKEEIDEPALDKFNDMLRARFAGRNGKSIVLSGAEWDVKNLGANQKDAEFSEGRATAKEEQLAGLVPPGIMGKDDATYANMQAQNLNWWEIVLDPALVYLCAVLDANLLAEEPEVWTEFNTDDVDALQVAKRERLKSAADLAQKRVPWDVSARTVGLDMESFEGSNIAFGTYTEIPISDIIAGSSKAEIATVPPANAPRPPNQTDQPPSDTPPPPDSVPRFIRVIDPSVMVRVVETRMTGPFDYQSTQVNLQGLAAAAVLGMAAKIPDSALAEKGRETDAHVTVKFGLDPEVTIQQLSEALARSEAVREMASRGGGVITFGATDIFPAEVTGKGYDVVHVSIDSPDLVALNDAIKNSGLKVADTQAGYIPHATLAYVQPGLGAAYAGDRALAGIAFTFDAVHFSDLDGYLTPINIGAVVTGGDRDMALANNARLARRQAYKKRDAATNDSLATILKLIRDDDAELQKIARRFHVVALNEGAKQIGDILKTDTLVGLDNPYVTAFLETRANLITSVNQTTGNQVIKAIKAGMESGDTPEAITKAVKGIFNGRKDADADLIAGNEIGSALNGGRNLQMQDEGVEASEWLSVRDDNVRESHAPGTGVDGEIVALGEEFSNGCTYPQDPKGDSSETIKCRCIALPAKLGSERMFKSEEQRAVYWRAARVTSMKNVEAQFASRLGRYFNDQRGRVLAELAKGLAA